MELVNWLTEANGLKKGTGPPPRKQSCMEGREIKDIFSLKILVFAESIWFSELQVMQVPACAADGDISFTNVDED